MEAQAKDWKYGHVFTLGFVNLEHYSEELFEDSEALDGVRTHSAQFYLACSSLAEGHEG